MNAAENSRAVLLMVAAMAAFALADMVIKILSPPVSVGQIILIGSTGGAVTCMALAWRARTPLWVKDALHWAVLLRSAVEALGGVLFVTALSRTDISSASAVLQASPLLITLGAVGVLGETVGWHRWAAIIVGFLGVLLVLQPGTESFDANLLYALAAMVALSTRDLVTRLLPTGLSSISVAAYAFIAGIPTGLFLLLTGGPLHTPAGGEILFLLVFVGLITTAFIVITMALRIGEVSVVAPYRYSRIVFALLIGVIVFGERPNVLMLVGCTLIIGAGLYAFHRETKARARLERAPDAR